MEGSAQGTAPLRSWLDRLRRLCCRPGKAGPLEDQQIASAWNKELVLIRPCGLALIHQGWRLGSGRCESLPHWRQLSSFTPSFIQQRQAERKDRRNAGDSHGAAAAGRFGVEGTSVHFTLRCLGLCSLGSPWPRGCQVLSLVANSLAEGDGQLSKGRQGKGLLPTGIHSRNNSPTPRSSA